MTPSSQAPATAPRLVEFIDCTLRDGEQTPGVWFTVEEKVQLARMLDAAGLDMLDAGFPAASASDLEALQQMQREGLSCRLAATARPLHRDIKAAAASRADEVFLFMPTSELRLKETLGISRAQAGRLFCEGAEEAASHGLTVNLVFEDASRAAPALMAAIARQVAARVPLRRAILADTVGCSWPRTMEALVSDVRAQIPDDIVICTHCHNDFGLAGANTLAAVWAGAAAVTCTVNGLGERAGNADLAETAAALTHLLGMQHHIDPHALRPLAQQVERLSGVHCSPTKPVTGFNVHRHESGVHVDGMLKDRRSYEFLPAGWTGRETEYVLGKHSGRALVRHLLCELGLSVSEEEEAQLLHEIKQRAESRDKSSHDRAWLMKEAFHVVCLSGVDPVLVLSACVERRRKHAPTALDGASGMRAEP